MLTISISAEGTDKDGGIQLFLPQFLAYYQSKLYVVGTQNNRFSETIFLSTHSIGLDIQIRILEHKELCLCMM